MALTAPSRLYLETEDPTRCVLIEAGSVAEVGAPCPKDVPRLACGHDEIRTGYVNAHTHLYSGLAPLGMPSPSPAPENFLQILERVWWRLDRALDRTSLRAAVRLYAAEALLYGTTTLVDHHESPLFLRDSLDVLADACQELGIRASLCYGATERNHGTKEAEEGLAECARFFRSNRRPLVRGLVGLHASFTVSDATIRNAGRLCRELGTALHVHVAEDIADVEDAKRRGYQGPVERLLALEALEEGSVLAHGVHLNESQVEEVAARGAWLVQNPRSNEGNAVGYPEALWASTHVALGTDGYPADMPAEQKALTRIAQNHKAVERDAATERLAAGNTLASQQWGRPFGGATKGSVADLIVVPKAKTRPRHVIVDGRPVVVDGILTTADLPGIRSEAEREAAGLWQRMAAVS